MSYPIKYPTPQGANIQIFNAGETKATQTWVKPQGASFVWFTLIGAGGGGQGNDGTGTTTGGGSGAVTNCMVPAFLIPDCLQIQVGVGGIGGNNTGTQGQDGTNTVINYFSNGTYGLLTANGGAGSSTAYGGVASLSNYFSCMGFFQSIAGQNGSNGNQTASATTFLAGGCGDGTLTTSNYGYSNNRNGFFQMQPIIVGSGGAANAPNQGGIGCGGGGPIASLAASGGNGGNGLAVIITW